MSHPESDLVVKKPEVIAVGRSYLPGIAETFSNANRALSGATAGPLHPNLSYSWTSLHNTLQSALSEHVRNLSAVAKTVLYAAADMSGTDDYNAEDVKRDLKDIDAIEDYPPKKLPRALTTMDSPHRR